MGNKVSERQSGIELLRIVIMLGVILLHYNNADIGGGFKYSAVIGSAQTILFIVESMAIGAVDIFVLISGYFLCRSQKRDFYKVVELFIQVIIFKIVQYLAQGLIFGGELKLRGLVKAAIPANYFVIFYAVIYILSPYINMCLEKLDMKTLRRLVITLVLLFSFWNSAVEIAKNLSGSDLKGLNTVAYDSSHGGYTIINFFVMYIIGAYLYYDRETIAKIKTPVVLVFMIGSVGITFAWSMIEFKLGFKNVVAWNYDSPFVILLAASSFIAFSRMTFRSKIINTLSGAAFVCFLFHTLVIRNINVQRSILAGPVYMILFMIGIAVGTYLLSFVVYFVYSQTIGRLTKLIAPLCRKVHI